MISLSKIFHLILSHPLLLWRVNILFSLAVNCETGWWGINMGLISCDDMYFVSKSLVNDGNVLLHMKLIMRTILMIPHSQPTHSKPYIHKSQNNNSQQEPYPKNVRLDSFYFILANEMLSVTLQYVTYTTPAPMDTSVDPLGNSEESLDISP